MLGPVLTNHYKTSVLLSSVLLVLAIFLSLAVGATPIRFIELWQWLQGNANPQQHLILTELRLPRTLMAGVIGALLATCGAVTQGLFRNPLADPSLIGVSSGASAGASLMIFFLHASPYYLSSITWISLAACGGGAITVILVYKLATNANGTSVATMLLAGIGITFLTGSIISLLDFFASNELLRSMSVWRMGGLDTANYPRLLIVSCVAIIIFFLLPRYFSTLNVLLLGESEARHLGIDVHRSKQVFILIVALGVGSAVAAAGTIAFVGLIVPHALRLFVGPNHHKLIPLSAIFGAFLLIVADTLARRIMAPVELPVGIISALLGAPLFIFLLQRQFRYGER